MSVALYHGITTCQVFRFKTRPLVASGLGRERSLSKDAEEHGSIQAGLVQEELKGLHLHLKAATRILASGQLG